MACTADVVRNRLTTEQAKSSMRPSLERAFVLTERFALVTPETYVLPETTQLTRRSKSLSLSGNSNIVSQIPSPNTWNF